MTKEREAGIREWRQGASRPSARLSIREFDALSAVGDCLAEIDRLRAALEFYADPTTYFAIGIFPDRPCGAFIDDFSETELGSKPGKRARAALEQK